MKRIGTIENYRDHMERLFEDWLDRPLARLAGRPRLVVERHDKITKENGPYNANGSMRSLRAVYNHARKSNTDRPPVNPVSAIDWNQEHRRKTWMGPNDISGWLSELRGMDNPLRREFHLLTLFSGSRPTALKNVRIEHIDLQDPYPEAERWGGEGIRHSTVTTHDLLHRSRDQMGPDHAFRASKMVVVLSGQRTRTSRGAQRGA